MKYPKLWDGSSPIGEAQTRAQQGIDAPFLTTYGPDSVSYKKNGFYEVFVNKPVKVVDYLWGHQTLGTSGFEMLTTNPEKKHKTEYSYGVTTYEITPWKAFVGDDYIARITGLADTTGTSHDGVMYHFSIARASIASREYSATELGHEKKTISFADTLPIVPPDPIGDPIGYAAFLLTVTTVPTGWDNDTKRYRYLTSYLENVVTYEAFGGFLISPRPHILIGATGDYSLTETTYTATDLPAITGVDNLATGRRWASWTLMPECIGRGKAICFRAPLNNYIGVRNSHTDVHTGLPVVDPGYSDPPVYGPIKLVLTTDHGDTWTEHDADFLTPYIYTNLTDPGVTEGIGPDDDNLPSLGFYNDSQLMYMLKNMKVVYLGSNKSLVIVPNAYMQGDPDYQAAGGPPYNIGDIGAVFRCIAFIGTGGTGYTKITWPLENFLVNMTGGYREKRNPDLSNSVTTNPIPGTTLLGWMRPLPMAFGNGCVYVPTLYDEGTFGFVWRIVFSRDFGATWTTSAPVPEAIVAPSINKPTSAGNPGQGGIYGIVVKPYVNSGNPGKIIFAAPDHAAGTLTFMSTDGNFVDWKTLYTLHPGPSSLDSGAYFSAWTMDHYFANYAKSVYAAFPGEFDKP